MYSLLRPLLFTLDPETAHHVTLSSLQATYRLGLLSLVSTQTAPDPRSVMGLNFPNPVGLAAGLDKNGEYIDALGALGFRLRRDRQPSRRARSRAIPSRACFACRRRRPSSTAWASTTSVWMCCWRM